MYAKMPQIAAAGAGASGSLAATGLTIGWTLVAALTLIFLGLALVKLAPRRRSSDR
jgi:hypothetical protein